jgi:uncharacterized protein (DUF924 family)
MTSTYQQLLNFWFPDQKLSFQKWWFKSTPQLDQEIKTRWEHLLQSYTSGELENWKTTAQGYVALIILLDQLPRNMYRGTDQRLQFEVESQQLAHEFLHKGYDSQVNLHYLVFALMPLRHSSKLTDQECVQSVIKKYDTLKWEGGDLDTWQRFKKASLQSFQKVSQQSQ